LFDIPFCYGSLKHFFKKIFHVCERCFVHDLAGNWTAPLYVLLAITALELPPGLVAARGNARRAAPDAALSRTG